MNKEINGNGLFRNIIKDQELEMSNNTNNNLIHSVYIAKNSQLVELEEVKIVWSNREKCYKLIKNEGGLTSNELDIKATLAML